MKRSIQQLQKEVHLKIEVKFEFDSIEEMMQKMPALASARTPAFTPSVPTASSVSTPRPTPARAVQGAAEGAAVRTTAGLIATSLPSEDAYLSGVRSALRVIGQDGVKQAVVKAGHKNLAGDPLPIKDPMPNEEMRESILEALDEMMALAKIKTSAPATEPEEAKADATPAVPAKITKDYYLTESTRLQNIVGNFPTADVMKEIGHINAAGKPLAPKGAPQELWAPILEKLGALAAAKEAA